MASYSFCSNAAEPIDVVRIRLTQRASATAVVSEFRAANRVLADWAAHARSDCQVDFEVTFFDGLRVQGRHALLRKGKCHPSLSRVVRRLFKGMAAGAATEPAAVQLARYVVEG